jgi:hypothetical protein
VGGHGGRLQARGREVFFFEKKNQKTFDCWYGCWRKLGAKFTKVFCFFFSKKKAFLPYVLTTAAGGEN